LRKEEWWAFPDSNWGPADYEYLAQLVLGVVRGRSVRGFEVAGVGLKPTEPWPNFLGSEGRFNCSFGYAPYGKVYVERRTKTELVRGKELISSVRFVL